jgi:type VI protein secretion system component VasF
MKMAIPRNLILEDQFNPSRRRSRMVSRQTTLTHLFWLQLLLLVFLFHPVDALLNLKSQKKIHPTTTTPTAASMGRLMLLRAAPTSEEVRLRLVQELERLREKDRTSRLLRPMVSVVDRDRKEIHTYLPHGEMEEKHQSHLRVDTR